MSRQSGRADWSCPDCDSIEVYRQKGNTFECDVCGQEVHESVGESAAALKRLADRGDKAGRIAQELLETGGISE